MTMKLTIILTTSALIFTGCLSLPDGLHVYETTDGCTSTGFCPYGGESSANYYYAPLREIVISPGQGKLTLFHEGCHAHQHQVILDEIGREPTLDMREWIDTAEGQSFITTTGWTADGGLDPYGPTFLPNETPWAWLSHQSPVEDFANTCALWLAEPEELRHRDPLRYAWAERHLQ